MSVLYAVGRLWRHGPYKIPQDGSPLKPLQRDFLGTCFAFRRDTHFLTAAHCVVSIPTREIAITVRDKGGMVPIAVVRHETADIALLVTPGHPDVKALKDSGPMGSIELGLDFFAYGYPSDSLFDGNEPPPNPLPRLFKGYFQRTFEYRGKEYRYAAGEMNIPCPQGFSGGPVIALRPNQLVGVATANMRSAIAGETIEEVRREGFVERTLYQEVVNYGVCLLIDHVRDWLNKVISTTPIGNSDSFSDHRG